jgi:acyl-coenzyme A thioesterase PaaI-like protein
MSEDTAQSPSSKFPKAPDPSPLDLEKRRAGSAIRRIIDGLIMKLPSEANMAELANRLEQLADEFEPLEYKTSRTGFANQFTGYDIRDFMEFSPLVGFSNPVAPPLVITPEGSDRAVARVNFGKAFEGAPGHVHGGYVAAAFDELLGFTQGFSGEPGMTGTLTTSYRKPTPLLTDLFFEATYDGMEGRKIYTSGKLFAGDTLCAEATGLFIALKDEHYEAVRKTHAKVDPNAAKPK